MKGYRVKKAKGRGPWGPGDPGHQLLVVLSQATEQTALNTSRPSAWRHTQRTAASGPHVSPGVQAFYWGVIHIVPAVLWYDWHWCPAPPEVKLTPYVPGNQKHSYQARYSKRLPPRSWAKLILHCITPNSQVLKAEAQRGRAIYLKAHSQWVAKCRVNDLVP